MFAMFKVVGNERSRFIGTTLAVSVALLGFGRATASALDRTPPTKPTNFRVTAKTAYSVSLAWGPSTDKSGNFSYVLASTGNPSARVTLPKTATSYTFTSGLFPRNSYTFIIQAVDGAGNASSPISVSTTLPADTTPPTTSPVLSATDVGSAHVSLAWSASTDDGPLLFYSVFVNGNAYADAGTNQSFVVTSLQPGTTYTFNVQARDYGGNWSPISNPVTVATTTTSGDTTPPTTPGNLTDNGMHFDDGETWLFWQQSTDDQTPQSAIRYDVFVNGVFDHGRVGTGGPSVVYGVAGASNTFQVIAVDAEGNESEPATLMIP